jgi:hypothetical protein
MKNDKIVDDAGKADEEILDFEFDELSEEENEGMSGEASSTDDPIELVDVIEKGEMVKDSESDDIVVEMKDIEGLEGEGAIEKESDLSSDEVAQAPDSGASQRLEADLDAALEGFESFEKGETSLEISDSDLEGALDAELPEEEMLRFEDLDEFEETVEKPESADLDRPPKLPRADLSEVAPPEEQFEAERAIGISEERIEAIVARVVEDVVERVARETMTTVTEKLVREAIVALKESLESSHD